MVSMPQEGRPDRVLAIAASAGGFGPLKTLVELLPLDIGISVFIVTHVSRTAPSHLAEILDRASSYRVVEALDRTPLVSNTMYVAPPDHQITIFKSSTRVSRGPREHSVRPAAGPLFRSVARWFGPRAIGLVLSGLRDDGAAGLAVIHRAGGLALVQDPNEADFPSMPDAAINAVQPHLIGSPKEIVDTHDRFAVLHEQFAVMHERHRWLVSQFNNSMLASLQNWRYDELQARLPIRCVFYLHLVEEGENLWATWRENQLVADAALRDRANLLIRLGKSFALEVGRSIPAGLEDPFPAALTLIRCADKVMECPHELDGLEIAFRAQESRDFEAAA